ncbi:MAG: Clp1/GlmU family protein [Methanomicrobiales archaeon]|nr:Clp1/GlmU family protein [Methanomicrobiales archaeon]
MTVVEPEWQALCRQIRGSAGRDVVYVLGGSDRGKTTLARHLAAALALHHPTAFIDCDMGQSGIGPPATVGMRVHPGGEHLRFVGSTSPSGHLLQTLAAEKRLLERALALGAAKVIVDSSGFAFGSVPEEFQFQTIDLLQPDHLVAIQRGEELEDLLDNFRRHPAMRIHRLAPSFAVVERGREQRRAYRERLFREYFRDARIQEIPLAALGVHGRVPVGGAADTERGLLVGLNDAENFLLALGILEDWKPEERTLTVFAPPYERDSLATIQFGSLRLDRRSLERQG